VIQYISGIVHAALSGWDHEVLLKSLRMPVSGLGATPAGDKLDFDMRKSLPAAGFDAAWPELQMVRDVQSASLAPEDWAARLKPLRKLVPKPEIKDRVSYTQIDIWRSTAAALEAFETALDTTALALDRNRMTLGAFWRYVETTLSLEELRVPDRRRNVVNVLDVYEARQWELPIAFVCGLVERHFPQYHREPPFPVLPSSSERQEEEKLLYELAVTRATEELVLSYPRFNEKGDPALRSFFLDQETPVELTAARPFVKRDPPPASEIPRTHPDLRKQHAQLSPTSIESFLQCPFQFFAKKTLRLRERPLKPRDRLNVLLQGSILHKALAGYVNQPMFGAGWIDQVFCDECRDHNIPPGYRTEAVRLELLRHFEAFITDRTWPLSWPSRTEQDFTISLTRDLAIRGRIDRLDLGPRHQAIVIDYKYSAGNKIRERIRDHADGNLVQGGLYMLAAERAFQLDPTGMFYCGLRKSVSWDGWHANLPGLAGLGESTTPAALRELIDSAKEKAVETFEQIASGSMDVRPADTKKCQWCDYNDICRFEASVRTATGGAG
jgi:RecB family exonuclease